MDTTSRLNLPLIMPNQAQKHITHNQAIQTLDALVQPVVESLTLTTPPTSPTEGEAYLVPGGATGIWAGHAGAIAVFQSGAWEMLEPASGWLVYVKAERTQYVFDAGTWTPLASLSDGVPKLGVNAAADATNRLAVAGEASLFTHDGAGHQLKLNKAGASDTASLLYQTAFSGRAEMGLAGDDNWHLKVSADGVTWREALKVDAATGIVSVGASLRPASDNAVSLGSSGARWSTIWSATGTIQTSDIRRKTDIEPSDLGLQFLLDLIPVKYRWTDGKRPHYGLLAQQVKQALKGRDFAGYVRANPSDPKSDQGLRYDEFIAPIIYAIHELSARLDRIRA